MPQDFATKSPRQEILARARRAADRGIERDIILEQADRQRRGVQRKSPVKAMYQTEPPLEEGDENEAGQAGEKQTKAVIYFWGEPKEALSWC